ncbi:hypothetical protein HHK36_023999 [Tetracentron sinense]|uniref:Uncharacterized protein n=1 Tax=Tetracentron sinense TaxID=13715 RepID=A0A834YPW6_TETSI|nr:hypothetical protein HHK36_023999 [Tetracentron sinense]
MVIKTCSFKLNGPGFNENDHFVIGILMGLEGSVAAISFPSGRTTICAETEDMDNGFWRYPKNWFKKARSTQEMTPSTHVRNVRAGNVGSSVIGTVSRTCSTGESLTSSPIAKTHFTFRIT